MKSGGQCEIRTHGRLPYGRVPGDWIQPLSQLSTMLESGIIAKKFYKTFMQSSCFGTKHKKLYVSSPSVSYA